MLDMLLEARGLVLVASDRVPAPQRDVLRRFSRKHDPARFGQRCQSHRETCLIQAVEDVRAFAYATGPESAGRRSRLDSARRALGNRANVFAAHHLRATSVKESQASRAIDSYSGHVPYRASQSGAAARSKPAEARRIKTHQLSRIHAGVKNFKKNHLRILVGHCDKDGENHNTGDLRAYESSRTTARKCSELDPICGTIFSEVQNSLLSRAVGANAKMLTLDPRCGTSAGRAG